MVLLLELILTATNRFGIWHFSSCRRGEKGCCLWNGSEVSCCSFSRSNNSAEWHNRRLRYGTVWSREKSVVASLVYAPKGLWLYLCSEEDELSSKQCQAAWLVLGKQSEFFIKTNLKLRKEIFLTDLKLSGGWLKIVLNDVPWFEPLEIRIFLFGGWCDLLPKCSCSRIMCSDLS